MVNKGGAIHAPVGETKSPYSWGRWDPPECMQIEGSDMESSLTRTLYGLQSLTVSNTIKNGPSSLLAGKGDQSSSAMRKTIVVA